MRVIVDNHLPEMTSVHWHGFELPIEMDGVPGLTQDPIPPGGRFVYEFTLHQKGTFFYHSHMPMQEMMGMIGMFIMHPKTPERPRVDKHFGLILQEWAILPNNTIPNTLSMEFNWLTRYCQVDVERANLSRRADFLCSHRTAQVTSCQTMKARSRSSR